jgi:hypothetical protein
MNVGFPLVILPIDEELAARGGAHFHLDLDSTHGRENCDEHP